MATTSTPARWPLRLHESSADEQLRRTSATADSPTRDREADPLRAVPCQMMADFRADWPGLMKRWACANTSSGADGGKSMSVRCRRQPNLPNETLVRCGKPLGVGCPARRCRMVVSIDPRRPSRLAPPNAARSNPEPTPGRLLVPTNEGSAGNHGLAHEQSRRRCHCDCRSRSHRTCACSLYRPFG